MAKQNINIGVNPNDGTGDVVREAFRKSKENFDELYSRPTGDMNKSTYDSDNSGAVDLADKITGVDAAGNVTYYGKDAAGNIGFHTFSPDKVDSYADFASFPAAGFEGVVYIDLENLALYLWDDVNEVYINQNSYPAPYLEELIPDSYLPSNTGNLVLKGAYFTEDMTVAIEGQTVNYLTFRNDNEVRVNVTTGANEGRFDLTLHNGKLRTFADALLIVLGEVFKPTKDQWSSITNNFDLEEAGTARISTYNTWHEAVWDQVIDYTKDFSVRFRYKRSPLGNPIEDGYNTPNVILQTLSGTQIVDSDLRVEGSSVRVKTKISLNMMITNTGDASTGFDIVEAAVQEFRYVGGVFYYYVDDVVKHTYSETISENLRLKIRSKVSDIVDIKYIELM
jgi:hypothetical protein